MKIKMKNSILTLWTSYAEAIGLRDSGRTQQIETKRAFYAGAVSALQLVMIASEKSEAEGEKALTALARELDAFRRGVISGKE